MMADGDYQEDVSAYPAQLIEIAKKPEHLGRMNAPTSSAVLRGPCGDEMELYLVIEQGVIEEVRFHTDGCIATVVCAETVARLAEGKNIDQALGISPKRVKELLKGLPESHSHCSILAVSTLYRAIADYLLRK